MPWITKPQLSYEIKSGHSGTPRKGAVYPWLPAIILWNALSLENIIPNFQMVSKEDLKRILPTMTGHINFIGQFDLDFDRRPPFNLRQVD
jgi:hypothetical protein